MADRALTPRDVDVTPRDVTSHVEDCGEPGCCVSNMLLLRYLPSFPYSESHTSEHSPTRFWVYLLVPPTVHRTRDDRRSKLSVSVAGSLKCTVRLKWEAISTLTSCHRARGLKALLSLVGSPGLLMTVSLEQKGPFGGSPMHLIYQEHTNLRVLSPWKPWKTRWATPSIWVHLVL